MNQEALTQINDFLVDAKRISQNIKGNFGNLLYAVEEARRKFEENFEELSEKISDASLELEKYSTN
jgi:hypothetical protein